MSLYGASQAVRDDDMAAQGGGGQSQDRGPGRGGSFIEGDDAADAAGIPVPIDGASVNLQGIAVVMVGAVNYLRRLIDGPGSEFGAIEDPGIRGAYRSKGPKNIRIPEAGFSLL